MKGIGTFEAIGYGIKHMVYMGTVYALGFLMFGAAVVTFQNSATTAALLALLGLAVILGGLHGAIYKMAGDATARVLARTDVQVRESGASSDSGLATPTSPAHQDTATETSSDSGLSTPSSPANSESDSEDGSGGHPDPALDG